MYKALARKERSIELFYVSEQDVQSNGIEAPKLPIIPGTMIFTNHLLSFRTWHWCKYHISALALVYSHTYLWFSTRHLEFLRSRAW